MSTAGDIILRAFREGQITPLVSTPSSSEQAEALPLLNSVFLRTLGTKAGTELRDLNIGGQFDRSQLVSQWVPQNARLVCNLGTGTTLKLDPCPYEGQRVAVADASANFATHNLVLDGNGRQIEAAATKTLNASGSDLQWLYRADIANWTLITLLTLIDAMPFPEEFDDYFTIKLAMRLFPRNGIRLAQESAAMLSEAERAMKARYRKPRRVQELDTLPRHGGLTQPYGNGSTPFW
jgi:hypothetical protein